VRMMIPEIADRNTSKCVKRYCVTPNKGYVAKPVSLSYEQKA
jgi:hypothetical protein